MCSVTVVPWGGSNVLQKAEDGVRGSRFYPGLVTHLCWAHQLRQATISIFFSPDPLFIAHPATPPSPPMTGQRGDPVSLPHRSKTAWLEVLTLQHGPDPAMTICRTRTASQNPGENVGSLLSLLR